MSRFSFIRRAVVALTAFAALPRRAAHAETREVVIAYWDMVVPWRYAQASGEVEKATGYKVTFRKLDSGADVIRALAGPVQLGEAGSSPIAAGLSQGRHLAVLGARQHQRRRGARRAQRLGRHERRIAEGQEDRRAIRVDVAFPHARRAAGRGRQSELT